MKKLFASLLLAPLAWGGFESPTTYGNFDWALEGLFEVKLECRETVITEDCASLNRNAKMVVLNTGKTAAVSIGFPEMSLVRYAFLANELKRGGRAMRGQTTEGFTEGPASEFELEMESSEDEKEIIVNGWIRDPRFLSDIRVSGTQVRSSGTLFQSKDAFALPPTNKAFLGRFLVTGDSRVWILTVRQRITAGENEFLAEINDFGTGSPAELPTGLKVAFRSMQLFRDSGVLSLITPLASPGAYLKWNIALEPGDDQGTNLRGLMYSSMGASTRLFLQRIL